MNTAVVVAVIVIAFAGGTAAGWFLLPRARRRPAQLPRGTRRILLPFTGMSISRRSFDAAVRLARAEDATIMPAYLARVPRTLPLDAPLPSQCLQAMPLLEAIEQRASTQGVAVDARVIRGRTYRDALRRILDEERFDRVIVSAHNNPGAGFTGEDLVWLLARADAEVLILRPAPEDHREVATSVAGHF
jgi:hypothetical protein